MLSKSVLEKAKLRVEKCVHYSNRCIKLKKCSVETYIYNKSVYSVESNFSTINVD